MIEFNPPGYQHLLQHIQNNGYSFALFHELTDAQTRDTKRCFMRHDVDVSLDFALQMAKLENSMGIRATYFVMLRSPIYNLLSRSNSLQLEGLRRHGHQIGLHFDVGGVNESQHSMEDALRFELDSLGFLIGEKVTAFSMHQPTQAAIARRIAVTGVINTYHPQHLHNIRYLSDSNRDWRGKNPLREITSGENSIQILTHPVWWMCEYSEIELCWDAAVLQNLNSAQEQLLATERAYGVRRHFNIRRAQSTANLSELSERN